METRTGGFKMHLYIVSLDGCSVNTQLQLRPIGSSSEGPVCVKDRDTYHANLFHGLQLEVAVGDEPKFRKVPYIDRSPRLLCSIQR